MVFETKISEKVSERRAATDLDEGLVELITEEQHPSNVFDSNSDERPLPL